MSKQFLSGYDVGLPTRFFDFPLQQNKTWNLHLAGLDFPVKANFSRNVEGGGPGFVVEGTAITGEHIRVVYSIDNRWMSRFALADETGRNLFTRTLSGHGNYSGRYFLAQSEELYGTRRNGTTPQAPLDTFAQGRDYDLLHLAVDTAGTGLVDLRVIDPAGQVRFNFTAAGPSSTHQEADLPALGGAWRVVWNVQGPIDAFLNIAGITVTEGNV